MKLEYPKGWKEVSLETYIELVSLNSDGISAIDLFIEQLAILSNTDPEELNQLPLPEVNDILTSLNWLNELPQETKENIIKIRGKEYGFIQSLNKLTLGEWIDLEELIEENALTNIHKILAILYRPIVSKEDENKYIIETYNSETLEDRAELFKKEMMLGDVYGVFVFFSHIELEYMNLLKDSLMGEILDLMKQK